MSQMLPHTVRIKRKRQDEPVETLHVHTHDDPKKRRFTLDQPASSFPAVFRRVQVSDPSPAAPVPAPAAAAATVGSAAPVAPDTDTATATATASSKALSSSSRPSSTLSTDRKVLAPTPITRRFHLSTKSAPSPSGPASAGPKRKNVATLIETKPKKTRTGAGAPEIAEYVAQKTAARRGNDVEMQVDEPVSESFLKRPGRTARSVSPAVAKTQQPGNNEPAAPANKPVAGDDASGTKNGQADRKAAAVDPGLLSEMQKFAQEVEHAEQTPAPKPIYHQPTTAATTAPHTPQKLKFQPKATPRYRDRHPEAAHHHHKSTEGMDVDDEEDSDGEYVYDTYVRYDGPPETELVDPLTATSLPPDVGLLVISAADQPLWEAFLESGPGGDGDDKEFDTDDEDENAEDFYANEYPEDEVASDDERDENAYGYRVNASDEEEYGLWSDEEESLRRPWGRGGARPGWLKERSDGEMSE
ncbi:hypothetical protein GTA08_BOTSDO00681 [Neofusicoccum parvum]|uniref:Uncharacterized protein n=1 Tax=Neofusicoccum parvum TaxID=310453 RepID=A0ACB5SE27_9PEZI|nr:hypothetical protein GTA08_BOTSDO00681 [Neofusicoccum parvum]